MLPHLALEPKTFDSLELRKSLTSWSDAAKSSLTRGVFNNTVHSALNLYDLPDLHKFIGPEKIARQHLALRYRIMMGPGYRADMWAALDLAPDLTATQLARKTYGNYSEAWKAKKEWGILNKLAHQQ